MPFTGGVYTRTDGTRTGSDVCQQEKQASIGDTAFLADVREQDLATGLNLCRLNDGSKAATANLPMGGFKHTGAAQASATGQYVEFDQANAAFQPISDVLTALAEDFTDDGTTITAGDKLASTSDMSVGGNLAVTGTSSLTGKLSLTSTDSMAIAKGTTAQRNGSPTAGDVRYNSTLNCLEYWNGAVWVKPGKDPTVWSFTSGTSQTYTHRTGVIRVRVRMVAGGGGGGASNTNNGSPGTNSVFGDWTCVGGGAGTATSIVGGTGGSGGTNGTGTLIARFAGQDGGAPTNTTSTALNAGGGSSVFGGGPLPSANTAGAGKLAGTNTGGGGSAGMSVGSGNGSGGGAGEYVEFYMNASQIGTSLTYTVGAGGTRGLAGTQAGGDGAAGIIIVEEFYS